MTERPTKTPRRIRLIDDTDEDMTERQQPADENSLQNNVDMDVASTVGSGVGSSVSQSSSSVTVGTAPAARSKVFTNNWAKKVPSGVDTVTIYCSFPRCTTKYIVKGGSTGNITKHLTNKHFVDPENEVYNELYQARKGPLHQMIAKGTKRPAETWSEQAFKTLIVDAVIACKLPFHIMKSPELQELLYAAQSAPSKASVKLLSPNTLCKQITLRYTNLEVELRRTLADVPKIAFTLDGWTDPFQKAFLGVTAHWIDIEWKLQEVVIGFEPLGGSHTGLKMMEAFAAVVERFGLERKVMSITSDNASNVKKMMQELATMTRDKNSEWNVFDAQEQYVPCLAHIINLAVQALLGKDGLRAAAPKRQVLYDEADPEEHPRGGENAITASALRPTRAAHASQSSGASRSEEETASVDVVNVDDMGGPDSDSDETETDSSTGLTLEHCGITLDESDNSTDLDGDEGEVDGGGGGGGSYPSEWLRRLRKGITKIRCSQTVLGKSDEYRRQRNLKVTFILDVRTRWNSTFAMLRRAQELRAVYTDLCDTRAMEDYSLTSEDWDQLGLLCNLLKNFAHLSTKACSSTTYTSIPLTIFFYNKLIDHVEDFIAANKKELTNSYLCNAAEAAKEKLQKYYGKTDQSSIYAVATSMHPMLRFRYWEHQQWETEYRELAEESVRRVWRRSYKSTLEHETISTAGSTAGTSLPAPDGYEIDDDLFGDWALSDFDDLDEYTNSKSGSLTAKDALMFWRNQEKSSPHLAKMARDYLAIPATSTPSERCFSQAKLFLPHNRNRLSSEKIRESVLMSTWNKIGLGKEQQRITD